MGKFPSLFEDLFDCIGFTEVEDLGLGKRGLARKKFCSLYDFFSRKERLNVLVTSVVEKHMPYFISFHFHTSTFKRMLFGWKVKYLKASQAPVVGFRVYQHHMAFFSGKYPTRDQVDAEYLEYSSGEDTGGDGCLVARWLQWF